MIICALIFTYNRYLIVFLVANTMIIV